jgi:hypothetical protein
VLLLPCLCTTLTIPLQHPVTNHSYQSAAT